MAKILSFQMFYFLWTYIFLICRLALASNTTSSPGMLGANATISSREQREIQCLPVRQTFAARGLDGTGVPRRAIKGDHLKTCAPDMTCCTQEMEFKLGIFAKQDFDRMLHEYISKFKALMISRTTRFDDYFTELLRNARTNLHDMFTKTYGVIYQDNSAVFSELFDDLENFYRGSRANLDLQQSMTRFLRKLYQKMFTLLNVQYSFEPSYLVCVGKTIDTVKPFGDVGEKLTQHLKRAFTDARTFVQALAIGRDTARTALEITLSPSCVASLTRMMYCPHCRGLTNVRPCSSYCLSTVKTCLSQHIELDVEWNQYIDALLLMVDRLKGPFNIETMVVPLDVKISEAIMNLQEKATNISEKVFSECGRPKLAKRAAPNPPTRQKPPAAGQQVTTNPVTLDQLTRDIRDKLAPTRNLWNALPGQLCVEYGKKFRDPKDDQCWNGVGTSKNSASAEELPTASKLVKSNEPSDSAAVILSPVVSQQLKQLRSATATLKQAYNGNDVEWIESVPDDEDLENDDEDADTVHQGSGSGEAPEIVEGSGYGERIKIATPAPPVVVVSTAVTHEVRVPVRIHTTTPHFYFETSSTPTVPTTRLPQTLPTTTKESTPKKTTPKSTTKSSGSSSKSSWLLLLVSVIVLLLDVFDQTIFLNAFSSKW